MPKFFFSIINNSNFLGVSLKLNSCPFWVLTTEKQIAYREDYWKTPIEDFEMSFRINFISIVTSVID